MLGGEKEPEKKPTPKKPMSTATEAVVTGPKSRKTVEARRQKPLKKKEAGAKTAQAKETDKKAKSKETKGGNSKRRG